MGGNPFLSRAVLVAMAIWTLGHEVEGKKNGGGSSWPSPTAKPTTPSPTISGENLLCERDLLTVIKGEWTADCGSCSMENSDSRCGNVVWIGSDDGRTPDTDFDCDCFELTVVLEIESGGDDAGVMFRTAECPETNNAGPTYYVGLDPGADDVIFGSMDDGWTELYSATVDKLCFDKEYTLSIRGCGDTYSVFVDGEAVLENVKATDFSSGSIGLRTYKAPSKYHHLSFSCDSSTTPAPVPTPWPTAKPTTAEPTAKPTASPSAEPSSKPTAKPSAEPSPKPTAKPTADPSAKPSAEPSSKPTRSPSAEPSPNPTAKPTEHPTAKPTTAGPTEWTVVTHSPSSDPSADPTASPTTAEPTREPTAFPTFPVCDTDDALNIAFLMDESGSVDSDEWDVIVTFVDRIATYDVAGPSYVSLFEYASLVAFTQFLDWTPLESGRTAISNALTRNPYNSVGTTYTWDAVNRVLDEFWHYRKNCTDGCETRHDILFLLTDGAPTDTVCPDMVERANTTTVDIVIIGIGTYADSATNWMSQIDCLDVADDGEDIYYVTEFEAGDFNAIEGVIRNYTCSGEHPASTGDRGGDPWVYDDGSTGLGPVPTANGNGEGPEDVTPSPNAAAALVAAEEAGGSFFSWLAEGAHFFALPDELSTTAVVLVALAIFVAVAVLRRCSKNRSGRYKRVAFDDATPSDTEMSDDEAAKALNS